MEWEKKPQDFARRPSSGDGLYAGQCVK